MKSIRKYRAVVLFLIDIIIICIAHFISDFLISSNKVFLSEMNKSLISNTIILSLLIHETIFMFFKIYKNITRYENGKDYIIYIVLSAFAGVSTFLIGFLLNLPILGIKQIILSTILISVGIVSCRVVIRFILNALSHVNDNVEETKIKNLLIIGAGEASKEIIKAVKTNMRGKYNIVRINR